MALSAERLNELKVSNEKLLYGGGSLFLTVHEVGQLLEHVDALEAPAKHEDESDGDFRKRVLDKVRGTIGHGTE